MSLAPAGDEDLDGLVVSIPGTVRFPPFNISASNVCIPAPNLEMAVTEARDVCCQGFLETLQGAVRIIHGQVCASQSIVAQADIAALRLEDFLSEGKRRSMILQ